MFSINFKEAVIKDILRLKKSTQRISTFLGMIIITQFFLINFINGIFLESLKTWAETHLGSFRAMVLATLLYTPLVALIILSRIFINSIKVISFEQTKVLVLDLLYKLTAILLKPLEYTIYPMKLLIVTMYFSSKAIYEPSGEGFRKLWQGVSIAILVDIVVVFLLSLVKVTYFACYKAEKEAFFAKIDGSFEQAMLVLLTFNAVISGLDARLELQESHFRWINYSLKLFLNLGLAWAYFREIPYFNHTAHILIGNLIGFQVCFFSIFEASDENFDTSFKIFAFVAPIFFFLFNLRLKMAYYNDSLENNRAPRILKRLLAHEYKYDTVEEVFAEVGVIKAHFSHKRRVKPVYQQIWKEMSGLKASSAHLLTKSADGMSSRASTQNEDLQEAYDQDLETGAFLLSEAASTAAETFSSMQDIKAKKQLEEGIARIIMKYFTEAHHRYFGGNYSKYLRIVWMLDKEVVIADLLKTLAGMVKKKPSFRNLYFYCLAKQEMQQNFRKFYYRRGLLMRDSVAEVAMSGSKMVKIENEIRKLNKVGVDLAYYFKLKTQLTAMTSSINSFVEINLKYIKCLRAPSKTFSELTALLKQLYNLKYKIQWQYEEVHRSSRPAQFIHLVPYFYFQARCVNRHRSASNIFKLYKQRLAKSWNSLNLKMIEINDSNILHNGLIFKIESQELNFGKLLSIYGDPVVEGIEPQDLVGKSMDELILKSHRRAHQSACERFFHSKVSEFLGENFTTFLKIPKTCYIYPVSMVVKVMPDSQDDFKFIVGVRFLKMDTKLYIMLKDDLSVEGYSANMKLLFNNPPKYLTPDLPISKLSQEVYIKVMAEKERTSLIDNTVQMHSDDDDDEETTPTAAARQVKGSSGGSVLKWDGRRSKKRKLTFGKFGDFIGDASLSHEKRSSMSVVASKTFEAVMKFTNKLSGKEQKRRFDIEVVTKQYHFSKFNYTYLIMTLNDDHEMKKWMSSRTIRKSTSTQKKGMYGDAKEALESKPSFSIFEDDREDKGEQDDIIYSQDHGEESQDDQLEEQENFKLFGKGKLKIALTGPEGRRKSLFSPDKPKGGRYPQDDSMFNVDSKLGNEPPALMHKMANFNQKHAITPRRELMHFQFENTPPRYNGNAVRGQASKITFGGTEDSPAPRRSSPMQVLDPAGLLKSSDRSDRLRPGSGDSSWSKRRPSISVEESPAISITKVSSDNQEAGDITFHQQQRSYYETVTDSVGLDMREDFRPMNLIMTANDKHRFSDPDMSAQPEGGAPRDSQSQNDGPGFAYQFQSSSSSPEEKYLERRETADLEDGEEGHQAIKHKSFESLMNIINGIQQARPPAGTGSVMTGLDVQTNKKYYIFEDSLTKRAFVPEMIFLMVLYLIAISTSFAFNWFLRESIQHFTLETSAKNNFFVKAGEFNAENLFLYSQVLNSMGYAEGIVESEKYKNFKSFQKYIEKSHQTNNINIASNKDFISNLNDYYTLKMDTQIAKIQTLKTRIYQAIINQDFLNVEKDFMFTEQLELQEHKRDTKPYTQVLNYYQATFHLYSHRLSLLSKIPLTAFKKDTKNKDLLFLTSNTLNVYMPEMENAMQVDYKQLENKYREFRGNMIYVGMSILLGLMLLLMALSILVICIQRSLIRYILIGFMSVTTSEFDDRENELITLNSVFSGFLENGCCDDFMGFYDLKEVSARSYGQQRNRKENQKAHKRFSDNWYCFNLLFIALVIIVFYFLQIGYSVSTLNSLHGYTDQIIWGIKKEETCKNLLQNQLIFYTTLMQRLIYSNQAVVNGGEKIDDFLTNFDKKIRDESELIFDLSRSNDGNQAYKLTKDFLEKVANSSLCSALPGMVPGASIGLDGGSIGALDTSLCKGLDNGIAQKGLVQTYFRVTQYLQQVSREVVGNAELRAETILRDPEFVEFQFAFENVYYPAFLSLLETVYKQIKEMMDVEDEGSIPGRDFLWLRNLILVLSCAIVVFTFARIDEYMRRACFSFQLICIYTVLRNISVKLRFLKVYNMNQKQL